MMKILVLAAILLLNDLSWSSKVGKTSSIWPKHKVTLSDSYLPAVAQILTYLLDKIDEMDTAVVDPEGALLSSLPTVPSATTTVSILNATIAGGDTTTVRSVVVVSEDVLKDHLKPSRSSSKPSVVETVLGRLRDLLILEGKRQGIQKMQGYSRTVLDVLRKSSLGTSEKQLKTLMELMLKNNNIKRRSSLAQASLVMAGLNMKNGSLQKALANIPALTYTL